MYAAINKIQNFVDFAMINHPVHIINGNNQISPSAFIPFCSFGGNISSMGEIIDSFPVPVCNSFVPKVLHDEICYEVDLNRFRDNNNIGNELRLGFNFYLDYNEDRQVTLDQTFRKAKEFHSIKDVIGLEHAFMYLDTIG